LTATRDVQLSGNKFDEFDWDLIKAINSNDRGNVVVSPISLKVLLAMLYEGALGKTASEIEEALDLNFGNSTLKKRKTTRDRFLSILNSLQTVKDEYDIKIATHVFIDKKATAKDQFQCKVQHYYKSDIKTVDFTDTEATVKDINMWASNATEGHIQDLLSDADAHSNTIMLLLNAVYFNGQWKSQFPENQTESRPFHVDDKTMINVPLMNTTDKFLYFDIEEIKAELIRLPYKGDKFAMYVLLPYHNQTLDELAQILGPDRPLTKYLKNMTEVTVNLIMPKFEFDFTKTLRPILEKLKIKKMFTSEAELSDIATTKKGGLVVSSVLQKAGISVTEQGTVAYAATVVELQDKFGGTADVIDFVADHPFMFFIEDEKVNTTVFVGKVTNPAEAKVVPKKPDTPTQQPANIPQPTSKPTDMNTMPCTGSGCTTDRIKVDGSGDDYAVDRRRFNWFDSRMLKEITHRESGNFVMSPASVKALLAMLLEAAEGSTLAELRAAMRLPEDMNMARELLGALPIALKKNPSQSVIVTSATNAFYDNKFTINNNYSKTLSERYSSEVTPLSFMDRQLATNKINEWVQHKTGGMIPTLIEPDMIDENTFAVLASAIYFEGKWKNEFHMDRNPHCFYSPPNYECKKLLQMSKNDDLKYGFDSAIDSHVVQIPYQDERYSMVLVVPAKRNDTFLRRDADKLTFPRLVEQLSVTNINIRMPKFTIEYGAELMDILTKLDLHEVFTEKAKLPYMFQDKAGRVSAMVHKAKIDVTDKGTSAAAASGVSLVPLSSGPDPPFVNVDHPFYFFIYEQEMQTVLFAGHLSSVDGNAAPTVPVSTQGSKGKEPWGMADKAPTNANYNPHGYPTLPPSPPPSRRIRPRTS